IRVSVVYAASGRIFNAAVELPERSTVADAIERSGIRGTIPSIEIRDDRVGIFARKTSLDAVLRDGDRVEIYRSLKIDPKEARRRRANSKQPANERK
ncbi:MAG: RnfH family protein, partial [Rhodanobacteraceae bacterium]